MIRGLKSWLLAGAALTAAAVAQTAAPPPPKAEPVNFKIITTEDPGPEGPGVTRTCFTVGKRLMAFRKPQHCQVTSDRENLTVILSGEGISGQFTLTSSPFPAGQDLTAGNEDLLKAATATLPREAVGVKYQGEDTTLYVTDDRKSIAYDWDYSFFAHPTHRQLAYIDLDPEHEICLTIIADEASWKATYSLARRFIKSCYWLEDLKAKPAAAGPEAAVPAAAAQ